MITEHSIKHFCKKLPQIAKVPLRNLQMTLISIVRASPSSNETAKNTKQLPIIAAVNKDR